jgi:chaperonin GroES
MKVNDVKAINDHVIVRENIKTEETTSSGIVIPQTVKVEPQKYGEVVSIGEKVENIKIGDVVMFHQSGGQAVIINGEIYRVLKNSEIYCKVF